MCATADIVAAVNEVGAFPTRSLSQASLETVDNPNDRRLRELGVERGGNVGTLCRPGCVNACCKLHSRLCRRPMLEVRVCSALWKHLQPKSCWISR
jgi:hypothetical protein